MPKETIVGDLFSRSSLLGSLWKLMDALLRRARDVRFISSTVKNENKTEGEQKKKLKQR